MLIKLVLIFNNCLTLKMYLILLSKLYTKILNTNFKNLHSYLNIYGLGMYLFMYSF